MRILVVEDDKDVGGFVVKGLREAGHTVEHADNGRDGLFMAASENFDAIILDRMLPGGIDGLRLLETLRAQDNVTPVLFLSALGEVDDRVKGLKAGGDDYLTKPFANRTPAERNRRLCRTCLWGKPRSSSVSEAPLLTTRSQGSSTLNMYPALRTVCRSGVSKGLSIFWRRREI